MATTADAHTLRLQGFAEYQQRLKDSLAAIMRPDALAGALPVLPDFAAGFAALSEHLPAIPSMASLPRLPSMAELSLSSHASAGAVQVRSARRRLRANPPRGPMWPGCAITQRTARCVIAQPGRSHNARHAAVHVQVSMSRQLLVCRQCTWAHAWEQRH